MSPLVRLHSVAALLISSAGLLAIATAPAAADGIFLLNYDIEITTSGSDDVSARIQQQGIRFSLQGQFHGSDLGHYSYVFTLSGIEDNAGKLTVEVYLFETRAKTGEPISESINVIDFEFGIPVRLETKTSEFSADIALSISSR
jgi:hypothetical protein